MYETAAACFTPEIVSAAVSGWQTHVESVTVGLQHLLEQTAAC